MHMHTYYAYYSISTRVRVIRARSILASIHKNKNFCIPLLHVMVSVLRISTLAAHARDGDTTRLASIGSLDLGLEG